MRSSSFRKCLIALLSGSYLFADTSCIPNREQINQTINTSILQGFGLAITLGIQSALTAALGTDTDATTTDGTTDTGG